MSHSTLLLGGWPIQARFWLEWAPRVPRSLRLLQGAGVFRQCCEIITSPCHPERGRGETSRVRVEGPCVCFFVVRTFSRWIRGWPIQARFWLEWDSRVLLAFFGNGRVCSKIITTPCHPDRGRGETTRVRVEGPCVCLFVHPMSRVPHSSPVLA